MVITWGFVIHSAASRLDEPLEWQPLWALAPRVARSAWPSAVDFGPRGKLSEKFREPRAFARVESVVNDATHLGLISTARFLLTMGTIRDESRKVRIWRSEGTGKKSEESAHGEPLLDLGWTA